MARASVSLELARDSERHLSERGAAWAATFSAVAIGAACVMTWLMACAAAPEAASEGSPATTEIQAGASTSADDPSDDLLARCRAALERGGQLPAALRRELAASTDPDHARARRIFAAIDAATGEAKPGSSSPPVVVAPGSAHGIERAVTSTKLPPSTTSPERSPAKPVLTMLTSVSLEREGPAVVLVLGGGRGSDGADVGVLSQPESDTVRVVVKTASALPNVMQARPKLGEVAVKDVARGDGTVIFTVGLPHGWKASAPRRAAAATRLAFTAG